MTFFKIKVLFLISLLKGYIYTLYKLPYLEDCLGFLVLLTGDYLLSATQGGAASLLYWHTQNSLHVERS